MTPKIVRKLPKEVSKYFSELGKKGGPAAAKARFDKLSAESRSETMRNVVRKRWDKTKAESTT